MMAYFPDLAPCTYFGSDVALTAVGWLEGDDPQSIADLEEGFFDTLVEMLVDPWQPVMVAGHADCPFCRFTGGPKRLAYRGHTVTLGVTNLFVPGKDTVFVMPSLAAHYIDAHSYTPPMAFQTAVLNCPPMRSMNYLKALRTLGVAVSSFVHHPER